MRADLLNKRFAIFARQAYFLLPILQLALLMKFDQLLTETRNALTRHIDRVSTLEILQLINQEDARVAPAIKVVLPAIAQAVERIVEVLEHGGRLIYLGAGTSGRLGILDASECPPTYSTPPEQIIALIAGGEKAITQAVENAEDNQEQALIDLQHIRFSAQDVLVGIAASGRTPYVLAGIEYAHTLGATTIGISCTDNSVLATRCDIAITPIVGAEVITGSTRMKAGTAQKLILNMLSTASMIKMGKVYENLMVDLKPSNEKLIKRQWHILQSATACNHEQAKQSLQAANGETKTAILMLLLGISAESARALLHAHEGNVYASLSNQAQHDA